MAYHPQIIRPETMLSSWVFCWVIIYFCTKYISPNIYRNYLSIYANPVFALLFAIGYQFYVFIQIILNSRPLIHLPRILAKFFVLTFFAKLLPLYVVLDNPPLNELKNKILENATSGIPFFIVLSLFYFVYITKKQLSIFEIYEDLTESYVKDDGRIFLYFRNFLAKSLTYLKM